MLTTRAVKPLSAAIIAALVLQLGGLVWKSPTVSALAAGKRSPAAAGESNKTTPAVKKHHSGAAAKEESGRILIPVFFITDRNREPKHDKCEYTKFGRLRQYIGRCNHDPHMGVAYAAIDNTRGKAIDAKLTDLGWKHGHAHKEGTSTVNLIDGCTYEEAKDKFYEDVYGKSQLSPDHEILVFAPGYMSTFESGLQEAARFAYYSERPVILYSWPSMGKFRDYTADEASIEWSQEHYNDMIQELMDLGKRPSNVQVRLLAHSMGSRLVVRAAPLTKGNPTFAEISVVCPDIDDGLVKHYMSKCVLNDGRAMVRLYMSRRDRMLKFSQLVHGGYQRFGEDKDITPPSPYKPASSECSATLSADALKRFQTIDFTEMDEGTLGHKIPVALICSMSRTGKPPENIEFKHKTSAHQDCNPLMMHVSHLDHVEKENTVGYYEAHVIGGKKTVVASLHRKLPVLHTFFGKDWTLK